MLKFQLLTPQDLKENAAIARRRQYEEQRKQRIFNARTRCIGLDQEALKQQIEEKRIRDQEDRKLSDTYAAQLQRDSQIALALERKEAEERRRLNQEIDKFRAVYQRAETRREYDLNDPDYLKKGFPARLHDEDPRCGISSAQKFEGEDLADKERVRVQREQLRSWLEQQILEREAAENDRKAAEDAYKAACVAQDIRSVELDRLERECRRQLDEATTRYNKALAAEQESQRRLQRQQELEDNMAEIYNCVTGDFLTENPDVSLSNMGLNKRIGFLYKGMSPEEQTVFRKEQQKQMEDNEKRRAEQKKFEKDWEEYASGYARQMALKDREEMQKRKQLNKQLAQENLELSKEQKAHKEYLERVVYTNRPAPSFFDQFNTSTR